MLSVSYLTDFVADRNKSNDVTIHNSFPFPFIVVFTCQHLITKISNIGFFIYFDLCGGGIA